MAVERIEPASLVPASPIKRRIMKTLKKKRNIRFSDYFDLIVIGLTHGVSDGFANLLVPVLALIVADLGLSTFQAGVLLSVRSVSTFLFLFPLSLLADHSGRKRLILIVGMTVSAASFFAMQWAPSFGLVAVLAFSAGSGNSVYHPCGTALTAERFVSNRAYAISFHSMMGNLGASLIPMSLAAIAGVGGWRLAVAGCTVPLVVLLPLIRLRFPSGDRGSLEDARSDIWKRVRGLIGLVLKNRNVVLLGLVYALRGMMNRSMLGFLPLLASRKYGMETPAIGVMLSLYFGVGVLAKPVMGFLYVRLGARLALIIPLLLTGSLVFAIVLTPLSTVLVVLVALIGATAPISPIILTAAADMSDKDALASSVGFIYTCNGLGFVSPLIGGWLAERYGMEINYIYSALMVFAAAAVALLLREPEKTSSARAPSA
jgi:DHA1 family L-arabinose/isopropyl-beta-D-thiogalactopyranoside export protein-like MFS transporter